MGEVHQREAVELHDRGPMTLGREVAVLRRFVVCAGCGQHLSSRAQFQIDHIKALGLGGRDVDSNLEPLCVAVCHPAKTKRDREAIDKAKRLAGETCAGPTRRPIPPRADGGWPPPGSRKIPSKKNSQRNA